MITKEPPRKTPQFPTVVGKVRGIDQITLFVFLPAPDQRQIMLFLDLRKGEYRDMSSGFKIYFFNDFNNTPTGYPFTDTQMKHLCAVYRYNHKERLDQLSWIIPPQKPAGDPG
jgi:hypothetical protein